MHRPERWIPLLRACHSESELVRVLREYLSNVPPQELAAVPAGAGLATFGGAVDVAAIAVSLAREELLFAGEPEARAALNGMTAVFTAAAMRLAEMQSERLRDRLG